MSDLGWLYPAGVSEEDLPMNDTPDGLMHKNAITIAKQRQEIESLESQLRAADELATALKKVEKYAFRASGDEFLMWAQAGLEAWEKARGAK